MDDDGRDGDGTEEPVEKENKCNTMKSELLRQNMSKNSLLKTILHQ